ncbi:MULTISPECIES: hypothetical protein [unclassified Rhizobium]|uniref:hypothetical protein n=1 Tax=unclassified Rhizobium TaxID=2613769 RepID=UPI001FD91057|nr:MULTISPECIES: hypothetical protein [unclassified Rhizobium]
MKRRLEKCVAGNIAARSPVRGSQAYCQGILVSFAFICWPFFQQTVHCLGIAGDDTILAKAAQFDNNRILPKAIVGHHHLLRITNSPPTGMFPVLARQAPFYESDLERKGHLDDGVAIPAKPWSTKDMQLSSGMRS